MPYKIDSVFGFGFIPPVSTPAEKRQQIPGVNAPVNPHEGEPTTQLGQLGQNISDFASGLWNEGLGGLADMPGMMDRADARRDLEDKFIVGDGKGLPNQVTNAEFNDIARMYSDIRLGRGDLTIDAKGRPNPQQFRADMMDDIGDILQTRSGRQLIGALSNNVRQDEDGNSVHRATTLSAHLNKKGKPDTTNARQRGDHDEGVGSPYPDGTPGVGGDALVMVNPNMDVVATGKSGATSRYRSDVALYHELVHAYHTTQGDHDMADVSKLDGVRREAGQLNPFGMIREAFNTTNLALDEEKQIGRREHQAAGLGLYANDAMTENKYRGERNAVALSGRGIGGDLLMPQRERYAKSLAWYEPFFGY